MKKSPRIPIRLKLYFFGIVIISSFSIILYLIVLPLLKTEKMREREGKLAAVVESAVSMMNYYENAIRRSEYENNPLLPKTREEAQQSALQILRQLRYDDSEHLFILDGKTKMIMHPLKPDLEGKDMSDFTAPDGGQPFLEMTINSQTDGETFVKHNWLSKWSESVYEPQTTFAKYFYPWDWVVCSSVYTQDINDSVRKIGLLSSIYFSIGIFISLVLLYFISHTIIRPILLLSQKAHKIIKSVDEGQAGDVNVRANDEIGDLANDFNKMTKRLSETISNLKSEVADRKKAEQALLLSEEKYRQLIENANDAIFIAQDGVIKFPNPVTERLTGYSADELVYVPFTQLIHPDYRDLVVNRYKDRIAGKSVPSTYSFVMIDKNKQERWVQINAARIQWDGRPGILNFIRDISEQKKLESQLLHAQKMESLGTLSGGIAHDFNNLLTGILGNATLLMFDENLEPDQIEKLKNIEMHIQRGVNLTRQLLGLARSGKYDVKTTDINNLITICADMFGRTKKEIQMHLSLQPDIWVTEVDQGQIEQVLLNLFVNSWQAMPDGGDIYIETNNIELKKHDVEHMDLKPGKYIKISITDMGIGIDKSIQDKIFDPFFTTKGIGHGTGLGLSSAYGIIKNHGGLINVYSEVGRGTTFSIYLPLSDKEIEAKTDRIGELLKGNELILLIDDEELVLDTGKKMLERLGYSVIAANSGKQALTKFKEKCDEIDMVVLDVILPDMGGREIFKQLIEIKPNIKVLLASGYTVNGQAEEILKLGCKGFIQKPFNMVDLSQKIRRIIEGK